ncbi:MAG TPA: type IV pilin-like G/H family protein [Trichocoleus sp.]
MLRSDLLPSRGRSEQGCSAGFTLIEMLVVIIIVAILAAIALPAFINQARRAQQGEALTYIGAINRAQQAYRLDSITFADSIDRLNIGLAGNTQLYQYSVLEGSSRIAHAAAFPQDESLEGFSGVVYVSINPDGTAVTSSKVCQGIRGSAPALSFASAGTSINISGCDDL